MGFPLSCEAGRLGYCGSKAPPGRSQRLLARRPPPSVNIESPLGGGGLRKCQPASGRSIGLARAARALEAFACDDPVELVPGCAHPLLSSCPLLGPALVYRDAPYRPAARRSARRSRFEEEGGDPVALLELLKGLPCQVLGSGHRSGLYAALLAGAGWRGRWTPQAQGRPEGGGNLAPARGHGAR